MGDGANRILKYTEILRAVTGEAHDMLRMSCASLVTVEKCMSVRPFTAYFFALSYVLSLVWGIYTWN